MVNNPLPAKSPRELLVIRVEAYARRAGYADTTASRHVFNDGSRLAAIRGKHRMWPETIEAANAKLDELMAALPDENEVA